MAETSVIFCHSAEAFEEHLQLANEAGKLVVIDFTAVWCPPCRIMSPIFERYAQKYQEAVFLKVDVDELRDIAEKYDIEAMPTFLFIKDGEVVDKIVGANKEELNTKIKSKFPDILNESWSAAMTGDSVCFSILSMLSSSTKKQRPTDNDRYVKRCGSDRSPKDTKWRFHDDKA